MIADKKQTISGTITAPLYSANTGSITSPNFPHGYALNGEAFTYIIQNLDPYGHVRLVFDDWDLADESYIEVRSLQATSQIVFPRYLKFIKSLVSSFFQCVNNSVALRGKTFVWFCMRFVVLRISVQRDKPG